MIKYEELRRDIDQFLRKTLERHVVRNVEKPKVIHDTVHGTNVFEAYEVSIIDLPIIQRLRLISQTDVANLVFPSANHNRFEHSLGVAVIAGKMFDAIEQKQNTLLKDLLDSKYTSPFMRVHVRLAALFHDCGHGPFSHLSETLYGKNFDEIRKQEPFKKAKPHEILSYLIVTSEELRGYLNDNKIFRNCPIPCDNINYELIGHMIVGFTDSPITNALAFLVEIINGTFDADKLDYILRDSYATGIRMVVDIPRLLHTLDLKKGNVDKKTHLAIDISGVSALEEIQFNKLMLTQRIYHHQKVRAAGCLLKSFLREQGMFNQIESVVSMNDSDVFAFPRQHDSANVTHIERLLNRSLPVRAFCFSARSLNDKTKLNMIMEVLSDESRLSSIEDAIVQKSTGLLNTTSLDVLDVWIDSPKAPSFAEGVNCLVSGTGDDKKDTVLRDIFQTEDWHRAFTEYKWRGFVYTIEPYKEIVYRASKEVFEELFDVEFNKESALMSKIGVL